MAMNTEELIFLLLKKYNVNTTLWRTKAGRFAIDTDLNEMVQ
jgi:hypothetical protein